MPFHLEEIEQRSFNHWDELNCYVKEEEEKYIRIPIEEFYSSDSKFTNDKFFGSKGRWVKFNDEGMNSLCRLTHIPYSFLEKLSKMAWSPIF